MAPPSPGSSGPLSWTDFPITGCPPPGTCGDADQYDTPQVSDPLHMIATNSNDKPFPLELRIVPLPIFGFVPYIASIFSRWWLHPLTVVILFGKAALNSPQSVPPSCSNSLSSPFVNKNFSWLLIEYHATPIPI